MDKELESKLKGFQEKAALNAPPQDTRIMYNPNKRRRQIRRQVYERFYQMRDDPLRQEAEADWEMADKEYHMYQDPQDAEDWRANLHLPDAFAAIQAQAQETIERKSRPHLVPTEESDEPISEFCNSVLKYNMDNTGYDYQYYQAKTSAAIRGTAFLMDYWRVDKRVVKDPVGLKDGEVEYEDKEIVDFDDDYTEWVPNEYVYIDEKAKHIDEATDGFRREVLNINEFHRIYDERPGFFDGDKVAAGGETGNKSFFKLPTDITEYDVEVLHYYNRSVDAYWVVANNIVIHDSPLPWKHKELPFSPIYQYRIFGRFWGVGIPKIIHSLSEERKTIRNMALDRQKMGINKMFLHNSAFDIDDEDLVTRPHGLISVDTNGQNIDQAIKPIEYGDMPASAFKSEEMLLEDIHRATGIDDRVLGQNVGGTATEASILRESALKRVNLISIQAEMDTVVRIGKLKWSNIQFFYPAGRMDKIAKDKEEKVERNITVQGQKFQIVDDNGTKKLSMDSIRGFSAVKLDKAMAKYMEGNFDISVNAEVFTPVSKAIEQTKKTELFSLIMSNPATMAVIDVNSAVEDLLQVNNIKPDKWMKNPDGSKRDMMMLAESENLVMSAGQPLDGTPGATEDHTLVHLLYTKTQEFIELNPVIQQVIADHIMQEHDNNPATGSAAELMGAYGLDQQAPPVEGMNTPFQTQPGGSPPGGQPPQAQTADLEPTNFSNRANKS